MRRPALIAHAIVTVAIPAAMVAAVAPSAAAPARFAPGSTAPAALSVSAASAGTALAAVPAPAAPTAAPADTLRLTLDVALRRALDLGEEMQRARAQIREANGRVREALAGALPQLNASLTYTRQFDSIYKRAADDSALGSLFKNSSFAAVNAWNAELTATQLLYAGGKVGAALKGARALHGAMESQRQETASDVRFQVTRAYLDAIAAGRRVAIAEAGLRQARDHLRQVALYRRQGTRSEYELLRARVDASNQEPAVISARNDFDIALLNLKRLINVPLERPVALATPPEFAEGALPVPAEGADLGVAQRPALAAADAQVEAQRQLVRVTRADGWPMLTASTTLSEQVFRESGFPLHDRFNRNWSADVRLSVPIFTGFRTAGAVERARAQLDQARSDRDVLREQVMVEAAQARAELERAHSSLAARRATVREAERAYELAGVRFTNGLSTQLEVSDARLQMQTAELNQVQATRDYLLALAGLERALGRTVPVTLEPLDEVGAPNEEGSKP